MGPHGKETKVNLEWIPAEMPENATIVIASKNNSTLQTFLKSAQGSQKMLKVFPEV